MELATLGALIAIALGIGLGTFAGARHNKISDHLTRVFTVTGASLPLFWFALLMLILFYLIIPFVPLGRFDGRYTRPSTTTPASTRWTLCSTSIPSLLRRHQAPRAARVRARLRGHGRHGAHDALVAGRGDDRGLRRQRAGQGAARAVGDQAARSPQRPHPDRHGHRHGLGGAVAGFGGGGERVPMARPRPVGHRRRPPRRQSHDHGLRSRHRCRVPGRQPRRRRHLRVPRPEGHPRSGQLGGRTR